MLDTYALAPNRLAASGYGEYYPAAFHETAEGRAMNRRVGLVILNSNAEAAVPPPPAVVPGATQSNFAPQ